MKTADNKINVIHFNNGSGGGVLSVIKNLIEYSQNPNIENHVIYTIEKKRKPIIIEFPNAASIQFFFYDKNWNFNYTCKRLAKLLPNEQALLVAHDWLELGMASHLGLQNPVVQFLHGDYEYYYDLAVKHIGIVDAFVTVADSINQKLRGKLLRNSPIIRYLRFPVPEVALKKAKECLALRVAFVGRLSVSKGFNKLPLISTLLQKWNVEVQWHIVGDDVEELWNLDRWGNVDVTYYGPLTNEEVRELLPTIDCIILPSIAEGMPVSLVEAMKAGVVPVVSDIEGGIQELVVNFETGFKIDLNDVAGFAECLRGLYNDTRLLVQIGMRARKRANNFFSPVENTSILEEYFIQAAQNSSKKRSQKIYGSRLDKHWIPNRLVKVIRETLFVFKRFSH